MPYSAIKDLPDDVKKLPTKAKQIFMAAFNNAFDAGNSEETCFKIAWAAVRNMFKKSKGGEWIEIKTKQESGKNPSEQIALPVQEKQYSPGEIIDLQFCCVGDNITDEALQNFVDNFKSNAYGQPIGLHVSHPFFTDSPNPDGRRYADVLDVYRKGTHEGWIKIRLNQLGATSLNNREYISLSPGWFTKYNHFTTGEPVKDVLFEISMTNIPAEKMMNSIIAMAQKIDPGEEPEPDAEPEKEKEPEEEETLEALLESLNGVAQRITGKLKNKSGNALLRAKFKDILKSVSGKLEEDAGAPVGTAEINQDLKSVEIQPKIKEVMKLSEQDKMVKTESKDNAEMLKTVATLEQKEAEIQTLQEKIKTMETERRKAEIQTLAESFLPQPGKETFKIRKEQLPEVTAFMQTLDESELKQFTAILEAMPGMTVALGEKGTDGSPTDAEIAEKLEIQKVKALDDEKIYQLAQQKADEEPDKSKRLQVYKQEVNKIKTQKGAK